ncbi:MAG TPA: spore coat U domain-containing protein [bacterium]|nr:spore coat U domain-containing protein [bacterium]
MAATLTGIVLASGAVWGGSIGGQLQVTSNVIAFCYAQTSGIDFGDYAGSKIASLGTISVRCNQGLPYDIALDAGEHYNGVWRAVGNSGYRAEYGLYDPSNDHEWGDSDYGSTYIWGPSVGGTGTGDWSDYPVRGELFAGFAGPAGIYEDTVLVTVHF